MKELIITIFETTCTIYHLDTKLHVHPMWNIHSSLRPSKSYFIMALTQKFRILLSNPCPSIDDSLSEDLRAEDMYLTLCWFGDKISPQWMVLFKKMEKWQMYTSSDILKFSWAHATSSLISVQYCSLAVILNWFYVCAYSSFFVQNNLYLQLSFLCLPPCL